MQDGSDSALRASRAMLGIVARSIAPALEHVTLPQFRVLALLHTGGPAGVGALAERLGAVVSTFSRSLDRLEEGGWVRREQGASDRRAVTVSISASGARLVEQVSSQRLTELSAVLGRLDADDRAVLDRAFDAFADAAGEPSLRDRLILGI